jgi:hypothetical protein
MIVIDSYMPKQTANLIVETVLMSKSHSSSFSIL